MNGLTDTTRALFAGKPWPTAERIAEVHELANAGRSWSRDWSRNVPTDCEHGILQGFVTETGWAIDVCLRCGYTTTAQCTHVESEWNEDGTLLRCVVCGSDGT